MISFVLTCVLIGLVFKILWKVFCWWIKFAVIAAGILVLIGFFL